MCMNTRPLQPLEIFEIAVLYPSRVERRGLVPIVAVITDDGLRRIRDDIHGFAVRFGELCRVARARLVLIPEYDSFFISGYVDTADSEEEARLCAERFAVMCNQVLDFWPVLICSSKIRHMPSLLT